MSCHHCGCGHQPQTPSPTGPVSSTSPSLLPSKARLVTIHKMGGVNQISPQMAVDIPLIVSSSGEFTFQYNTPRPSIPPGGSHCSDVRIEFLIDGQSILTSDWLGYENRQPALAMDAGLVTVSGLAPGNHTLTLQPEGRIGGCNSGRLYAWDGTVLIFDEL